MSLNDLVAFNSIIGWKNQYNQNRIFRQNMVSSTVGRSFLCSSQDTNTKQPAAGIPLTQTIAHFFIRVRYIRITRLRRIERNSRRIFSRKKVRFWNTYFWNAWCIKLILDSRSNILVQKWRIFPYNTQTHLDAHTLPIHYPCTKMVAVPWLVHKVP